MPRPLELERKGREPVVNLVGLGACFAGAGALVSALGTLRYSRPTHGMVGQIDNAVNGKPPGGQTLVSQVGEMHEKDFPATDTNGDAMLPILRRVEITLGEIREETRGPG